MTKVIIAEKPSVAKNIAEALRINQRQEGYFEGQGYLITWAFGHLLQLYDAKDYDEKMAKWKMENFPFVPETFKYKVKTDPKNREKADYGAKKQLAIIKQLIKRSDVDAIISACDYDREGQIIGDTIIQHIPVRKNVFRLLLNEWTPDEVRRGLNQLQPNEALKPLQDAGISRQWADWVIGINLTSVATLKYQKGSGKALNIGRVLLPTLKIIYDRDKEIATFKPEDYFTLTALFQTNTGQQFEGSYVEESEKFKERLPLELIVQEIEGKSATVIDKKVERKKEYPPLLFNLSNLQGYMTSKYQGWTSDKVLKVAQSLYEKKFITYPRTSSVVLDESLTDKAAKVLSVIKKGLPYENDIRFAKLKRVFNGSKVESHSAIMPTYLVPKKLTRDEELVYQAIKNRFIVQFMPVAEYEETKLKTAVNQTKIPGYFYTKGKVQLIEGWKKVEAIESKDITLPAIQLHDHVKIDELAIKSHQTKPPKPHTEKTLLRVMETCGRKSKEEKSEEMMETILAGYSIGTPATRAETIKKLKDVGYITAQSKNLVCTELGVKLVETLPIQELFDLEFTGRLEKTLADIEKRKVSKEEFLSFIFGFTNEVISRMKQENAVIINEVSGKRAKPAVIGSCPVCKHAIIEGKKGFGCSNWKNGCTFVIWKNDKYLASMKKKPTQTMVKTLLKNGEVKVKGLTSKSGNKFDAKLTYKKNPNNDYFSWNMTF